MKPTPSDVAQCLAAIMGNPEIRQWVKEEASRPGAGGTIDIWTDLAYDYAVQIQRRIERK